MSADPNSTGAVIDPEALALRGRPPRAVRLKRGVLVALAAIVAIAIALSGWLALRHDIVRRVAETDDSAEPAGTPTDTLGTLPKSYGDVPRLGPPLPGDLGKPILEHQQADMPADAPLPAPRVDPAQSERLAEAKAAAGAPLLTHGATGGGPEGEAGEGATRAAATAAGTPSAQGTSSAVEQPVDPHRIVPPASPYLLSAGSIIAANLITGLRSDLPGIVIAHVSEPVFDSATGSILLVPQGARLIGRYDNVTSFGQKRLKLEWQRLVFPDGSALSLDTVPATDASGYAGLEDRVNAHGWQLLKGAALSTLLGVGAELQFTGNGGLEQAIRESGQQSVSQAGDKLTSRALDIQPTLEIRPGAPVRLVVEKDLVLAPWSEAQP